MTSTVCMTDTSIIPFPTTHSAYTQTSNIAGKPLPHIPRRNSSSGLFHSSSSDSTLSGLNLSQLSTAISADSSPQSRFATYDRYDSESSSSSSTPSDEIRPTIISRSKRIPTKRSTTTDSPGLLLSTPTPIKQRADTHPLSFVETRKQTPQQDASDDDDTPWTQVPFCRVGKLRLEGGVGKHAPHSPDSTVSTSSALVASATGARTPDAQSPGSSDARAVRKKSGEPVKSSLKSSRRPSLHVVTAGACVKSEPVTPTHTKAVHFDSKLEHVKLFLAEQKPLAVSRDGSPTTDTSGTDDFPSFIYGDVSRETHMIKMLVPNMPSSPRNVENVALQHLVLSADQRTITGKVRVRNIAYEKWLAVRFTLDWWQTTSELTARFEESIEGGAFDIFTFSLRLHDIWSRIEEKTMFIALRYTVAGKEYWDNNAGQNYHVKFVPAPLEPPSAVDGDASSITFNDLNSKLEEVAKARSTPTPIPLARSFSADSQLPSLKSGKSLSSRYGFASASKAPWMRSTPSSGLHTRMHSYPSNAPSTPRPSSGTWSNAQTAHKVGQVVPSPRAPPVPLTSPWETGLIRDPPTLSTTMETKAVTVESPGSSHLQEGEERKHRRGYLDGNMDSSTNVRRTPTGSSAQLAAKSPPSIRITWIDDGGNEESSSPSVTPQSSVSSTPPYTPLPSPGSGGPPQGDTVYKNFIDQFCFYTGGDSILQESSENLPRSQSTSSIEQLLLSHSPPFASYIHPACSILQL
ncbi:putative phosphatase regulatory subunit-domain-containing protein [Melanogaster broomeanus]|nr:putative phosphatase regulatory subunit-domain-containing protein [Melanogaster broomeanus]